MRGDAEYPFRSTLMGVSDGGHPAHASFGQNIKVSGKMFLYVRKMFLHVCENYGILVKIFC